MDTSVLLPTLLLAISCSSDPGNWTSVSYRCGGLRQSPVDIVTGATEVDSALTPLLFQGHAARITVAVDNNGHSAHFSLPESVKLSGGGLRGVYRAHQFHLHWGRGGAPGSEHTIDGERYRMELHVVHVKEQYDTLTAAQKDVAGIAVLGFFFETAADDNPHVNTLIDALGRVSDKGNHTLIPDFRLSDIIPPAEDLQSYYRYVGSMTTPGCEQVVAWTVFQKKLPISNRQLAAISTKCHFPTGKAMVDIFRPVQPLDGRVVYRSRAGPVLSGSTSTVVLGVVPLMWTLTH